MRALAVVLIVLVGVWLRAHDLGARGLAMDESGTLWCARGDTAREVVERVDASQGQSPLYYAIVRATVRALGESETTVRLPSVVAGSLIPLLGFLALSRVAGPRAGAAALVLLALDPGLVNQSRSARPYALAEMAAAVALVGLAFTLRSGTSRARLLLWGGAAGAVYAHSIFLAIVPALAAGAWLARTPLYRSKDIRRDAALALGVMGPEIVHVVRLFLRRQQLAWIDAVDYSIFRLLLPWGAPIPIALAAVHLALRGARLRGGADRGVLGFLVATHVAVGGSVLAFLALGTNVVADRYLSLGIVLGPVLAARVLTLLPRWLAAACLLLTVALEAPILGRTPPRLEWREAAAFLDELARRTEGPVLINPGFIEQGAVVQPGGPGEKRAAFIASPFEVRPAVAEPRRAYLVLPKAWVVDEAHRRYFEQRVAPPLATARGFCVVGRANYVARVDEWVRARFAERRFRLTDAREFEVAEFQSPLRVARYEAP